MALTIVQDSITSGASMVWDFDGAAMVRKVEIGGVRSAMRAGGATQASVMRQAMTQFGLYPGRQLSSLPGQSPAGAAGWMCWTSQLDMLPGNDKIMATVRYRNSDYVKITLDGTVIRENTMLDGTGTLMKIGYTDDSGKKYPDCIAEAEAFRPGAVLEFERFENDGKRNTYDVISKVGYLNGKSWQGCPAYSWMFTSIKKQNFSLVEYGGTTLKFTPDFIPTKYSFQYYGWGFGSGAAKVVSDWRRVILYKNWQIRQVQPKIDTSGLAQGKDSGNGWKRVLLQHSADFNTALSQQPFPDIRW